jgi:hypothetical protein
MRHAVPASSSFGSGLGLGLAAVAFLAGCPDRTISPVDPVQGRVEAKDIPVKINRNVDILFVIDDSPSMADKQKNLAENFPKFINVLKSIQGGLPSVHIGVVTSDLGSRGADTVIAPGIGRIGAGGCTGSGKRGLLQLFGAALDGGDLFIKDILDEVTLTRSDNVPNGATLETAFAQMAKAGAGGCGFEQHLEAVKLALSPQTTPNAGFLRDDAFLAVIFIADEDDCSMQTSTMLAPASGPLGAQQSFRCTRFGIVCDENGANPDAMNAIGPKGRCHPADDSAYLTKIGDYVKFLKSLKPNDPSKVIVAGILGPTEPVATELRKFDEVPELLPALAHSCNYTNSENKTEVGDPAIRLKFFLEQFPNRNTFVPICQPDLSGGLQQIGNLLKTVIGNPCIEGKLADVDTKTPGAQYECSVSTVTNPNSPTPIKALLDACPGTPSKACWRLELDTVNCKTDPATGQRPDQLALKLDRKELLPNDTNVLANCVTAVTNN